jgi:methylmalonyl-CoA/ethylmalonyl-CoA epimerase
MQSSGVLDHVAIAVVDLEESVRWYRDGLGFEVVERRLTEGKKTAMVSAVMKRGSAIIVLMQGTSPDSQVSRFIDRFGPGVQHIALSVDDLDGAVERLKHNGGVVDVGIIEGPGIRQVFLRREPCSAVRVELIERKGGQFNDRSVEELFRAMEEKDII